MDAFARCLGGPGSVTLGLKFSNQIGLGSNGTQNRAKDLCRGDLHVSVVLHSAQSNVELLTTRVKICIFYFRNSMCRTSFG